jgi:hypothetical protein
VTVTRSLWLPVGAANFFSPMTDPVLLVDDSGHCRSDRREQVPGYIPFLRESVLRRLAEVLPSAFGYDRTGVCQLDGAGRPVSVTMTRRLGEATITLRVDESGFYTFKATNLDASELEEHIVTVFGGEFEVNRLEPSPDRRNSEGMEAVRRYNGLDTGEPPRGVLSFHQLNVMLEGLCNQSLLPAVFFEHYTQARKWLNDNRRRSSILTHLSDFLREVTVDADAGTPHGQIVTLQRFMTIARGSLQWMRRAVESVRRSLLDQMMAVSHRQARLVQLDLAGVGYERTPEMTGEATESQMRGYVMLVATKLPLLFTVADGARQAVVALDKRVKLEVQQASLPDGTHQLVSDLESTVDAWEALLQRLCVNVGSLETAVEHDWQERLLYEQEQARSEQEAMAEIERSRRGRPESQRIGDAAYNGIMLILTVVAVFVAIQTADRSAPTGPASPWQWLAQLWPVFVVSIAFFLAWPAIAAIRRLVQQRKPDSETYSFEFAFRLDERAERDRVQAYLREQAPQAITSSPSFRKIRLRRLGGWRVERISTDTTLLKIHSVAVVKLKTFSYARFEIVTEIMVRRISDTDQYFVRQCRMFGDSPSPLRSAQVAELVGELLRHACAPLAVELDLPALTDPVAQLV